MKPIVFTNVRIFDGTGRGLFPGQVRVAANRIDAVAEGGERIEPAGADIIDGCGTTLMPGMVAHVPSFVPHAASTGETGCVQVDVFSPPRRTMLQAMRGQ